MALSLILDTDIGTDVDDALALAFALRHPDIDLRAVTTVSGDAVKRARIARKLLELAGRDDVEVAAGVPSPLHPNGRSAWSGHEGERLLEGDEELEISPRDAVTLLLEECRAGCEIATVGMQSNVAAAIERDESFPARVRRLAVMGGLFARGDFHGVPVTPADEHNLNVDPEAALRSLNAPMPKLYVPGDVTLHTFLTAEQLERLRRADPLCQGLAQLTDIWAPILHYITGGRMPRDHVAILHDPLTVACMVDTRFVTIEEMPVMVALQDGNVRTFVDPVAGQPAQVVRSVDGPAFGAFFLETVLGTAEPA